MLYLRLGSFRFLNMSAGTETVEAIVEEKIKSTPLSVCRYSMMFFEFAKEIYEIEFSEVPNYTRL